jgi:hypothetical protein
MKTTKHLGQEGRCSRQDSNSVLRRCKSGSHTYVSLFYLQREGESDCEKVTPFEHARRTCTGADYKN